jgi:shikimate dehydrogenase
MGENTKKFAVIGNPIAHSASPAMHNAAFKELGLDYSYVTEEIPLDWTGQKILDFIFKEKSYTGINVTVPFKEIIAKTLPKEQQSFHAVNSGSVNTVVNQNGVLQGDSTDGPGFIKSLKIGQHKFDPKDKSVTIIGAGGASCAVCLSLSRNDAKKIFVTDLDQKKALDLIKTISANPELNTEISFLEQNSAELFEAIKGSALVINATPLGMHPHEDKSALDNFEMVTSDQLFYDLVYNPPETKFLREAKNKGAMTQNGLGMLLHQGVLAFKHFTGVEHPPVDTMEQALRTAVGL